MLFKRKVKRHYYWVVYRFSKDTISGDGACEIRHPDKCTSLVDINLMARWINDSSFEGKATVIITNFILLRTSLE
jgi:hypothetical protein